MRGTLMQWYWYNLVHGEMPADCLQQVKNIRTGFKQIIFLTAMWADTLPAPPWKTSQTALHWIWQSTLSLHTQHTISLASWLFHSPLTIYAFWVCCSTGLASSSVCLASVNLVLCHCSYFVLNVHANFGDVVLRLFHFPALLVKSTLMCNCLIYCTNSISQTACFWSFFNGSTPRLCEDQRLCVDYSLNTLCREGYLYTPDKNNGVTLLSI